MPSAVTLYALGAALLLALTSCGGTDAERGSRNDNPATAAVSDGQAAAQYPELAARLEQIIGRLASAEREPGPPLSAASAVNDLQISQSGAGAPLQISFSYRNCGDYNQDGRVAVSDLSSVGAYLGASQDSTQAWPAAQVADGNLDGLISAQDLAPIGANLRAQVDGYLIQRRPFGQPPGQWSRIGQVAAGAALPPAGGGALRFSASVSSAGGDFEFRVTPYYETPAGQQMEGVGGHGRRFNVLAGAPPLPPAVNVKASAGLYGDRVQVSWDPVPGALRHLLYRDGGPPIAMLGPTGAYVDFGVPDYLAHEYYVRAERGAELGPASASATGYLGERGGWPLLGGDSQHSGRSVLAGPLTQRRRWSFNSTDLLGRSGPVVGAEGSIYLAGQSGTLYCVRSTGYLKWSRSITAQAGEQLRATPALGLDGSVIVGSTAGRLYAVNQADGQPRWQVQLEAAVISAATVGPLGKIYLQNGTWLYCLSPAGQELWRVQIAHQALDWRCSPALGRDGTVYVTGLAIEPGSQEGYTHAISPAGELRWSFPSGALGSDGSAPAVGPDGTIYTAGVDRLLAIRPDGSLFWEFSIGTATSSPSIALDGTVLVNGSSLYAVTAEGQERWRRDDLSAPNFGAPLTDAAGRIYLAGGSLYQLTALELSGGQLWQLPEDGVAQSQPALAPDGSLILALADGRLLALRDD